MRLLWTWAEDRAVGLVTYSFRLQIHLRCWKVACGVAMPRPGREDYGLAKIYRVISLLNSMGKVIERVASELLNQHCEATDSLHRHRYGR